MEERTVAFMLVEDDGSEELGLLNANGTIVPMIATDEEHIKLLTQVAHTKSAEEGAIFWLREFREVRSELIVSPQLNPHLKQVVN